MKPTNKICRSCGELKDIDAYCKDSASPDKHRHVCRECASISNKAYRRSHHYELHSKRSERRRANPEENRRRKRAGYSPEKRKEYDRKYCAENREKREAKNLVNNAILRGALVRPSRCEACHEQIKPEAHHENYEKPFDVIWLCSSCHKRRHAGHFSLIGTWPQTQTRRMNDDAGFHDRKLDR
jgi:hypothetical protein